MKKFAAFLLLLLASTSLYGTGTPRDLQGIDLTLLFAAVRSMSELFTRPVAAADLVAHEQAMNRVEEGYNPIHGQ